MARATWYNTPATTTPLAAALMNDLEDRKAEVEFMAKNVKDYGAIGDGIVDDTAAIQDAIDATGWPTLRGAVYLPPGRYIVNGSLTIDAGTLSATPPFDFYGPGAELYTELELADPIVDLKNTIVSLLRVRFSGITFYANASSGVTRTCVRLQNSELCSFESCTFTGPFCLGIEFTGTCSWNRIVNCEFSNLSRGILMTGNSQFTQIVGTSFNEQLVGNPLNWIEANNGGAPTLHVVVSGCSFYGNGATLPTLRVNYGEGWTITGNNFINSKQEAIWFGQNGSCDAMLVQGNRFAYGERHDIYLNRTTSRTVPSRGRSTTRPDRTLATTTPPRL